MQNISIKKNEDKPETKEILAEAIIKISKAMEELSKSDLNENAIITLIWDITPMIGTTYNKKKISRNEIKLILQSIKKLRAWYIK